MPCWPSALGCRRDLEEMAARPPPARPAQRLKAASPAKGCDLGSFASVISMDELKGKTKPDTIDFPMKYGGFL